MDQKQQIKQILTDYIKETGVKPPFTRKKLEKAGYNVSEFLLEFAKRLEPINAPIVKDYLKACERLM